MGCSASRPHTLLSGPNQDQQQQHFSNSCSSQSPFSDTSSTPIFRTLSLPTPLVHHPPLRKGDADHLVSLTSTTYGSLILVDQITHPAPDRDFIFEPQASQHMGKTQTRVDTVDPPSPDTVINTWELMQGLDDDGYDDLGFHIVNLRPIQSPPKPNSCQLKGCSGLWEKDRDLIKMVKSYEIVERKDSKSKPLWKHLSEESLLAKLDPNVALSYRRALSSKPLEFKESIDTNPEAISPKESTAKSSILDRSRFRLPGTEDRIVLYFTSLRGIRKTYEDCCSVRMIFRGFRVCVDERDISMDSSFRKELQSVLVGEKAVSLPQVFVRGHYIGGADEIEQLHEVGELGKLLEGFPVKDPAFICDSCGDARFIPCPTCNGSRKVYAEEEGRQTSCLDCNENGLVLCSNCSF